MHPYIPNTPSQVEEMLRQIGVGSVEDLFSVIPDKIRMKRSLDLPEGLTEMELQKHMSRLAGKNQGADKLVCFLGAGVYDHYVPAVVDHLVSRSEFYTAYTPYQAEISQGILQAIFEYQTMICSLTGLEASNASMYDGASALAEACTIAHASSRDRNTILLARSVHPQSQETVRTYLKYRDAKILEVGYENGRLDLEELEKKCDEKTAAVCIQTPNFFGVMEDMESISRIVKQKGAMFIVSVDPFSLALFEPPGSYGADFAVGEGMNLGSPMSFGGPTLGFIATAREHIRKMPGRIVGETVDNRGKRGYVLTLQAREQHIRREKATSNICSNQALCALAATIYLAVVGKQGLKDIALRCMGNARYTYDKLLETGQFKEVFTAPFFKEFTLSPKQDPVILNKRLLDHGFLGGYPLGSQYADIENGWLVAVTEKRTRQEMDDFARKAGGQS
ncbi:MAG: aminomethyl-transferring glycine dehydrogenase subunit GcvPA [Clostridia bacterium]